MNLKLKIDQRQQANAELLHIIGEAVMKYPDLRFGQILAMFDIIQYKTVNKTGALGFCLPDNYVGLMVQDETNERVCLDCFRNKL